MLQINISKFKRYLRFGLLYFFIFYIPAFTFLSLASYSEVSANTSTPSTGSTIESVFKYDAGGQRIYKEVKGGDHTYYIDPTLEVTVTPAGSVSWRRLYSYSGVVTAIENYSNQVTNINYIHPDHLGSTTLITDDQGRVSTNQVYYPFGQTRYLKNYQQPSITTNVTTDRQYTNQISDQDTTGFYYYNARYYNPQIAKFTQADTVADGLNRYSYTSNNPINKVDPSGRAQTPHDSGGGGSSNPPPWTKYPVSRYNPKPPSPCTSGDDVYCKGDPEAKRKLLEICRNPYTPECRAYSDQYYEGYYAHENEKRVSIIMTTLGVAVVIGGVAICFGSACAGILASIVTNPLVQIVDFTYDAASCKNGDMMACGNIFNPIPGLTPLADLADNFKNLKTIGRMNQISSEAAEWDLQEFLYGAGLEAWKVPVTGEYAGMANKQFGYYTTIGFEGWAKYTSDLATALKNSVITGIHESGHLLLPPINGLSGIFRSPLEEMLVSRIAGQNWRWTLVNMKSGFTKYYDWWSKR